VLQAVQALGEAWMSRTTWQGKPAIRISVINWSTTTRTSTVRLAAFKAAIR
jgi:hypothetical protein